jgi:hypothetical protein
MGWKVARGRGMGLYSYAVYLDTVARYHTIQTAGRLTASCS